MSPLIHNLTPDEEVPILIIGGGPSGLLLAFLLEQLNGSSTPAQKLQNTI
jgi:cation diffusion facilitator CzcD-associated flavoprotein CzcO